MRRTRAALAASTIACCAICGTILGAVTRPAQSTPWLATVLNIRHAQERYRGPGEAHDALPAGSRQVFPINFKGGMRAIVQVRWETRSRLALLVYDEYDRKICDAREPAQTEGRKELTCSWTPAADGLFRAMIVNEGPLETAYSVRTN
jgi:hypothetical protein